MTMAVVTDDCAQPGLHSHSASLEIDCSPEDAFALLCAVEKWPVWLCFLQSARRSDCAQPLGVGSEVVLRSSLPGDKEQLYEVSALITNYHLSLVGVYSLRRRLDFRIERRRTCSKVHVRLCYPAYHGRIGSLLESWQHGRRLATALDDSLVHFKGLVEYRKDEPILADF
jgi:hypothetical protein